MKNNYEINNQYNYNQRIKDICNDLRSAGLGAALEYIPELTWILFLKFFDDFEKLENEQLLALGKKTNSALKFPYRWQDWAKKGGKKRLELENASLGSVFEFINNDLIPHIKSFESKKKHSFGQKILSQILRNIKKVNIDTEKNFLDVVDKIDKIELTGIDEKHIFPISQVYEGLLLRLGDKAKDGGQYFTPREVIRLMVKVVNPKLNETVLDPACGTGGFLIETMKHVKKKLKDSDTKDIDFLLSKTCYGKEKTPLIYPVLLANLTLHNFKKINIWHGNALTNNEIYGELYSEAPTKYDIILTNPPFGGKEGDEVAARFPYKTKKTQFLFLQDWMDSLKDNGRAASVVDEGILFRTDEKAFVQIKKKLLNECNLWCVISLPPGVFKVAGGNVKTNLIFFEKGSQTKDIFYYDLSKIKVTKKKPLTLDKFEDFLDIYKENKSTINSWIVNFPLIKEKAYLEINDLKKQLNSLTDINKKKEIKNRMDYLENKIYDLSAQNPSDKPEIINKNPSEILKEIKNLNIKFDNEIEKLLKTE